MLKFLLPVILLMPGFSMNARSQHLQGISMGNYAGTNALYHNPAFVADSRYRVHANLTGMQFYTGNNHVRYDAPFSFLSLMTNTVSEEYRTETGQLKFYRSYLKEKLNGKPKYLNSGLDVRLPSILFGLYGGRLGIGITTRARAMLNVTSVTESLARLISKTTKESDLQGINFTNQSGKLHFNVLGEVAFTIGGIVLNNETEFLKAGVTVKRLIGLFNAHALIDRSSYNIQPDVASDKPREYLSMEEINVKYALTRDEGYQNIQPTPAWFLGGAPPGSGWGFDLGAVYEYRPDINKYSYTEKGGRRQDASKNKYLYRVSVSVTDIGKVRFNNPAYVLQQETQSTNKEFRYDSFQKLEGAEGFFNAINESLDGGPSLPPNFKSVLPTAFQGSLDYHVRKKLYVNGLWVQNLIAQDAFGMKAESVLSITPRFEHKWYELSVPISLMNRYRSPAIGVAGRAGPLWIGTDHLAGLLNIGNPKSINVYFGLSAGLYRKPPESGNQCWPGEKSWIRRIFSKQ